MIRIARAIAASPFVNRWLAAASRRGGILAYHGIVGDSERPGLLHLNASRLSAHLEELLALRYQFISLSEMLSRLRAKRSVERCIAATFDDAYAGLELALPILKRLRVPATVFVPTDSIGTGMPFWWDSIERAAGTLSVDRLASWAGQICGGAIPRGREVEFVRAHIMRREVGRPSAQVRHALGSANVDAPLPPTLLPMDWRALRQWLQWEGATCAPHTVSHPVLPLLSREEQRREIRDSYTRLRSETERVLPVIAYPFGLYDQSTIRAACEAGMRYGVTMDRVGCAANELMELRVPRLPFAGVTPVEQMGLFLSSPWRWYRRQDWRGGYPALPGPAGVPAR